MLDLKSIIANPERAKKNLEQRNKRESVWVVDELLEQYESWKKTKKELEHARHQRNELSAVVNKLKKEKKDVAPILARVKDLPEQISKQEAEITLLQNSMNDLLLKIPNFLDASVPLGKDASENVEVRKWGRIPKHSFTLVNHEELIEKGGYAHFDAGRQNAGQGFNYLLGDMALLDHALQRYGVDFAIRKGFNLVTTPLMLNFETLLGALNGLHDFENVVYKVDNENLYLIGTGEHPLVSLYRDTTLKKQDLPLKLCTLTPCFRKEIGGHGVDTKGLFRMHQFNKVEQVVYCSPEDSPKMLEHMQKVTEEFVQTLNIPYRVIEMCSGDLGAKFAKQYDIEAWFPRQEKYAEITSAGNCTDYQARSLNTVYHEGREKRYVHMLNNTMVATSRVMVAVLENFQQKDGSVKIPEVLHVYMGKKTILGK